MKIALTTFISGEDYQDWIPFILYSIYKSYPDYHVFIFVDEDVRPDIKSSVNLIQKHWSNFDIIIGDFSDIRPITRIKAQSLRWVLWDKRFLEYDYLYYIDADILYIQETIPLHEQHIRHMRFIQSDSVSNIVRQKPLKVKNYYEMYLTLKNGGGWNLLRYIITPRIFRMSGLHFVKTKEYFSRITPAVIGKYRALIASGKAWNQTIFPNDEALLYKMMQKNGFDLSVFAIQRTSSTMFGFNNPEKREFCPHHGLHMGLFRSLSGKYADWMIEQLNSEDYKYYISSYIANYLKDELFKTILQNSGERVKAKFRFMHEYYNLNHLTPPLNS